MKSKEPFDFERFKSEAIESLYQGKKMGGTDGVFAPMLKQQTEYL
jgi:putative transposase